MSVWPSAIPGAILSKRKFLTSLESVCGGRAGEGFYALLQSACLKRIRAPGSCLLSETEKGQRPGAKKKTPFRTGIVLAPSMLRMSHLVMEYRGKQNTEVLKSSLKE